jgi:hypothetical protein
MCAVRLMNSVGGNAVASLARRERNRPDNVVGPFQDSTSQESHARMVYRGPYKIRVEEKDPRDRAPQRCHRAVTLAAICGSDLIFTTA